MGLYYSKRVGLVEMPDINDTEQEAYAAYYKREMQIYSDTISRAEKTIFNTRTKIELLNKEFESFKNDSSELFI